MIRAPPRFPLPLAAHRNFRRPPGRYYLSRFWVVAQVDSHRLNTFSVDQLGGLDLEFRYLRSGVDH
jgi:hypothetical protein